MPLIALSVRVPEDVIEMLDNAVSTLKSTRTALVIAALQESLPVVVEKHRDTLTEEADQFLKKYPLREHHRPKKKAG